VDAVIAALQGRAPTSRQVMLDCSHGNSNKDYRRQSQVFREVVSDVRSGRRGVLGLMLESNLVEGRQAIGPSLAYGQSITDGCIGWDETRELLLAGP
jgi:3-deoxy-7-phosphoheptulonate synthase